MRSCRAIFVSHRLSHCHNVIVLGIREAFRKSDQEGNLMVLTSIEDRVPAHISDIHMANIFHILVIGCRVDYVRTPNLELLHLIAEGDG